MLACGEKRHCGSPQMMTAGPVRCRYFCFCDEGIGRLVVYSQDGIEIELRDIGFVLEK